MSPRDRNESDWTDLLEASGPPAAIEPDAALRQAVLGQTTRVLRRRRQAKRFTLVAALLGCYVAGLGTGRLDCFIPNPATTQIARNDPSAVSGETNTPTVKPKPIVKLIEAKEPAASKPRYQPPSRFERLRRVSDGYLYQKKDVLTAISYYRKALDAATEEELAIVPEQDSWLLMSLKQELLQEKKNANQSAQPT